MLSVINFSKNKNPKVYRTADSTVQKFYHLLPELGEIYIGRPRIFDKKAEADFLLVNSLILEDQVLLFDRPYGNFMNYFSDFRKQNRPLDGEDFFEAQEYSIAKLADVMQVIHSDLPLNELENFMADICGLNPENEKDDFILRMKIENYNEQRAGKFSFDSLQTKIEPLFSYEWIDGERKNQQFSKSAEKIIREGGFHSKQDFGDFFTFIAPYLDTLIEDLLIKDKQKYFILSFQSFYSCSADEFVSAIQGKLYYKGVLKEEGRFFGVVFQADEQGKSLSESVKRYRNI